ncbi:MAG: ammonium transporter [Snowella sp.]|nr:MAG: ammonium transporter [Snowella sp.]
MSKPSVPVFPFFPKPFPDVVSQIFKMPLQRLLTPTNFQKNSLAWVFCIPLTAILVLISHGVVSAEVANTVGETVPVTMSKLQGSINTLWMILATLLVAIAYGGFAFLNAGFSRYKNVVNALAINLLTFIITTFIFWSFGFALLFGTQGNEFVGSGDWFLGAKTAEIYGLKPFPDGLPLSIFFLFETALAGITAMIVAGAITERVKFRDFLIFTVFLIGIAYSLVGHWVWGGGWLSKMGFQDFAGSTVIHSVGGWAAFSGLAILGPRMGKYETKKTNKLAGHSMSWAFLGCLMIWLGWFGVTAGSVFALNSEVPSILLVVNLAAIAGGFVAMITSWLQTKKSDLSLIIRGVLAALVAISGSCNAVSTVSALWIGAIAGFLAVIFIGWFDRVRLDDPVGVLSVHLIGGLWGTIATGIFDNKSGLITGEFLLLLNQLIGIAAVGVFMIIFSFVIWTLIKGIFGLRVGLEGELHGLDISEHGITAYNGFVMESAGGLTPIYADDSEDLSISSETPLSEEQSNSANEIQEADITEGATIKTKLENENDEIS